MSGTTDRPTASTVFHEKRTYRLRRTMDAARLLPILALILWCIPLIWPQSGEEHVSSASALIYIFLVWAGVIFLTWRLSRALAGATGEPADKDS